MKQCTKRMLSYNVMSGCSNLEPGKEGRNSIQHKTKGVYHIHSFNSNIPSRKNKGWKTWYAVSLILTETAFETIH